MLITFFGLLTLLSIVFVLGTAVLGVLSWRGDARATGILDALKPLSAPLVVIVSIVVVGGSLYLSEIKGFTPCMLCWIQRAYLYPHIVLGILLFVRRFAPIAQGAGIVMALLCLPVSLYHFLTELMPSIESSACAAGSTSCSVVYVREFGFITVPFMALVAAMLLFTLYVLTMRSIQRAKPID